MEDDDILLLGAQKSENKIKKPVIRKKKIPKGKPVKKRKYSDTESDDFSESSESLDFTTGSDSS